MITNIRLFHAKKTHSTTGVPAASIMLWLVSTLLLSSVVYFCLLPFLLIFRPSIDGTYRDDDEPMIYISSTHTHVPQAAAAGETTTTTTVKVITTPVFGQIPRHQASKDFQVLVRVEAPSAAAQQQRRVPIDLAVVLDVGTGTARMDAVKMAVKFIIRQIIHDDDRLVVVGPSSSIIRLLGDEATGFLNTREARWNAEKSVDELEPRGEFTSAAGAGLEEAIKILRELPATASGSSRARFIILVTDAATTEDSMRLSKLQPREDLPPVHTLGVGAAYDPRALLQIARSSQGTYSFVDDENSDDGGGITGAVAVCLSGLKDVVAVGARVRVATPVGSAVTIEKIESGGYSTISGTGTGTRDDKTSGEVAVGVLYAGEVKSFLVHLSVPALPSTTTIDGGCDKQQLLTATFVGHYTTTGDEEDASQSPQEAILYVQRPAPEGIDVAGGSALQRVPVPLVMNHIARFAALEMVTTFVDTEIWQRSSISITAEVVTKLRVEWEQFVQARQFWSGLDLGALDVEVTTMVTILEAAAAAAAAGRRGTRSGSSSTMTMLSSSAATAYMLSWVSSYQMQRPTAMGAPSIVAAAFVTVNMQLTLQQATTMVTTGAPLCIGIDGGCPACECECEDRCVEATPPPVLVPSGRDDGTFRVNAAYLPVVPGVLMDAINEAMKQMYLAMIQANKLRKCDDAAAAGVGVLPSSQPPPRAVAFV